MVVWRVGLGGGLGGGSGRPYVVIPGFGGGLGGGSGCIWRGVGVGVRASARRIKDSQGGHGRPYVEIPAFGGGLGEPPRGVDE